MNSYLLDTENAAIGLIDLIKKLDDELYGIYQKYQWLKERATVLQEFSLGHQLEDDCMIRFTQAAKAREEAENALPELIAYENKAVFNETALASICGALLQVAKQGMSTAHGQLKYCPIGRRMIGSQYLATVVWQARNQSIHFEEGNDKLYKPVIACFAKLEKEIGPQFSFQENLFKNMAWDIVKELEWTRYDIYCMDMESLLK